MRKAMRTPRWETTSTRGPDGPGPSRRRRGGPRKGSRPLRPDRLHGEPGLPPRPRPLRTEVILRGEVPHLPLDDGAMPRCRASCPPHRGRRGAAHAAARGKALGEGRSRSTTSPDVGRALENTHNFAGRAILRKAEVAGSSPSRRSAASRPTSTGETLERRRGPGPSPRRRFAQGFDSVMVCFSKGSGLRSAARWRGRRRSSPEARRVRKLFGGACAGQVRVIAAAPSRPSRTSAPD